MVFENKKNLESFWTLIIPTIVAIFFGVLNFLGTKYLLHVSYILGVTVLVVLMVFYAVKFLQDREKRWRQNNSDHKNFSDKLLLFEQKIQMIQKEINFNDKINKLQRQVSYLEGKNDRK